MNLHRHPGLLDQLAAAYALGTLRGPARHRFETLAARDQAIGSAMRRWQQKIGAIAELVPPQTPPPSVWHNIEARLGLAHAALRAASVELDARRSRERWFDSLALWRGWAAATTVAAVVALGFVLRPLAPSNGTLPAVETHIGYVSALQDNDSRTMLLLTWNDINNMVTVRFLGTPTVRADQSLQLWGLPAGGQPVSLGVMPLQGKSAPREGVRMLMKMPQRPQDYSVLAVSIEPKGGSPNPHGPSGPVIYSGKLVSTT